jgi:hypothetical protein
MNIAKDGWFTELGSLWPGQGLSLKVKEVLYKGNSKFQVTPSDTILQFRKVKFVCLVLTLQPKSSRRTAVIKAWPPACSTCSGWVWPPRFRSLFVSNVLQIYHAASLV